MPYGRGLVLTTLPAPRSRTTVRRSQENALSAPGGMRSFGNSFTITGSWTVLSANGQVGSITGRGTDNLHTAGARVSGTYRATS
jgi:hypothetical protein